MLREVERERWQTFLGEFSERNRREVAQLQISGQVGAPIIERDLLLEGIAIDMESDGAPRAELSFGGAAPGARPVTRSIQFVCRVSHQGAALGRDEVLDILSESGVRVFIFLSSRPNTTAA